MVEKVRTRCRGVSDTGLLTKNVMGKLIPVGRDGPSVPGRLAGNKGGAVPHLVIEVMPAMNISSRCAGLHWDSLL